MYDLKVLHLTIILTFLMSNVFAQTQNKSTSSGPTYLLSMDDSKLDMGIRVVNVFALDDRAPLSSNPHFQAMWNLIKLGASLESLLQGLD